MLGRSGGAALALAIAFLALPAPAATAAPPQVKFKGLQGFDDPGTPDALDRVGVIKTGSRQAENVLLLNPGTSASAAYFAPLAKTIVEQAPDWQVWSVERRENLLEDQSMLNRVKDRKATPRDLFDYYLGYLTDSSVTTHFQSIPDSEVPFGRRWGMNVAVKDLRNIVAAAARHDRTVVMGGHSLGGSITTAYATWDFGGRAGAEDLGGLVFIDGGSSPTPVSDEQAAQSLVDLEEGSPWLSFGGITAPFAGLFNIVGSTFALQVPDEASTLQNWPLLPENLKPPVPATSEAGYGYALDTETSPPGLAAAQVHAGHLAASGDPRGWVRDGELSPIERVATMFSGTGLESLDGTAWYHPRRLTIDSGAVAAGNANSAQAILDVRATHGADLGAMPLYAFAASLGGTRVLDAARVLAAQSGIPKRDLTLVDRQATYSHVDPVSASPKNAFVKKLIPFLGEIDGR